MYVHSSGDYVKLVVNNNKACCTLDYVVILSILHVMNDILFTLVTRNAGDFHKA